MDEARKLKSCSRNVEWLKEKLLKEQEHRERGEVELPELKEIEAMGLTQSTSFWLQNGSCKVLLSNKPDVSPYNNLPQKYLNIISIPILFFEHIYRVLSCIMTIDTKLYNSLRANEL